MSLKKTGDWDRVMKLSRELSANMKAGTAASMKQIGLRGEAIAVKHLRDQDLKWKKLNKGYLKWKKKKGLSEKTLIATSQYMQSITSVASATSVTIGVYRGQKDKKGKTDLGLIAKVMEFGSVKRGIPARPLWRPTFRELTKFLKSQPLFSINALNLMRKSAGK